MVIECCSQERSYSTFYGLTSERFCKLNRVWSECYERAFETYYDTIHRYETNRLRNIARLFGHLLANDAISWAVMQTIKMNEDDTTSSSRIFVKIMMQEVTESMGLPTLKERFADPEIKALCTGMFPLDNPKNTRFAINYFTSVGLGALTEEMREHLKVSSDQDSIPVPKLIYYIPYRMRRVLLWNNDAQCWRLNRRPPTVPLRTLIRPPLPVLIPTLTRRMDLETATATAAVVPHPHHHAALSEILPVVGATTPGHHLRRPVLVGATTAQARVNVRRRHGRAYGIMIGNAIMTAEATHGIDTGIDGVDGKAQNSY